MKAFPDAQCGQTAPGPTPDWTNQSPRILVVDDDSDIRQLSVGVLGSFGYQVHTAADGEAGWEALQGNNYDLLITDNNMPKLTGVELVKKLRLAGMTLAVILASGSMPTEELQRNPDLQLAAMLPKPFAFYELLDTVKIALHPNRPGIQAITSCS